MRYFSSVREFFHYTGEREQERRAIESYLSELKGFDGYCGVCRKISHFEHRHQPSGWSDLRENIICSCGLNGRMRMLFEVMRREIGESGGAAAKVFLFEQTTPFFAQLKREFPSVSGCEFLGPKFVSGAIYQTEMGSIRHEDICQTSIDEDSIDLVFHGDVLEHIADWKAALKENLRILKPGGKLLFSVPAFNIEKHGVRALDKGSHIEHLTPPAYHGNPVNAEGSLVFTDFSVVLVDDLRDLGFSAPEIGLDYDPFRGIVSNNNPYDIGRMWPIFFRATKQAV